MGSDMGFWTAMLLIVALLMSPALLAVAGGLLLGHRKEMAKLRMRMSPPPEQQDLHQLAETAQRLEQRLIYLESVLDNEAPGWRGRSDRG